MRDINWLNTEEVKAFVSRILVENALLREELESTKSREDFWFSRYQEIEKQQREAAAVPAATNESEE